MVKRHRATGRTHRTRRVSRSARRSTAPLRRRRWVGLVVLGALVTGAALFLTAKTLRRQRRQPAVPSAPSSAKEVATPSWNDLPPTERVAALQAEELRLVKHLADAFPQSEQPVVLLGDVYHRRGAFDQAVEAWERAVQMNPLRVDVYNRLAQVAFETDAFEKAISLWRKALEHAPSMPSGHVNVGRALMRLGQYEESIPEIQREIEMYPDVVLSHFVLGRAYQHLGKYEQAKAAYEKVIELQPDHKNAYYGLYNVCTRLKLSDEAQRYLPEFKRLQALDEQEIRRLDEITTDLTTYTRGLASLSFAAYDLYREAGDVSKSEALLRQAIRLAPENTTYIERLVALHQARREIPEALGWSHRIAEIDPENVTCQLNLGLLSVQAGRVDDAVKAFRRAIEIAPKHYGGYQELAQLYLRLKTHLPEARQLAQQAVALEPSARNYFLLGLTCLATEDPTEALPALKRATELEPQNAQYAGAYRDTRKRMLSQ